MTLKQTLEFTVDIAAPRAAVWDAMLGPETYKVWTAPFCEGSYYTGSWEKGQKIRFLTPAGEGMVAEIAENRRNDYVSIRHLGEITPGGAEDTTSDKVRAWAPAYENYAFADLPDGAGTRVRVSVESLPDYVDFMQQRFPKALQSLKALCEKGAGQR